MIPFGFWGWNSNMFPYTNFHDMNLDWIIWQVKHNKDSIEQFSEQLTQMGVDIDEFREYIENIDSEIQQEVQTQVPIAINHEIQTGGFNNLLSQSHKRRIVFIGDSYGDGWTPDGTFPNWIEKCAQLMQLASGDYIHVSQGGAGFSKPSSAGMQYVPNMINYAYEHISNPVTVTDVIIGMGYNDYNSDGTTIKNGIITAVNTCKQKFPTARVHIFAIGFCTNLENQNKLGKVYTAYKTTLADFQFYNISEELNNPSTFSTDGIHPLENGQQNIAMGVIRGLYGGEEAYVYTGDTPASQQTFDMILGGTQTVTGFMSWAVGQNNKMYLTNNNTFKNITLATPATIAGATWIKLAKLTSTPRIGYYYPRPYVSNDAIMYYRVENDSTFHEIPIGITLAQDMAHNDPNVYLWIQTKAMSSSGFKELTNVNLIGIIGACIETPFITKIGEWLS